MIHLYTGDGKGKTTAAAGLALRAHGQGLRVCFAQFLKDGSSGEVWALGALEGVEVLACAPGVTFTSRMDGDARLRARREHDAILARASDSLLGGRVQLLVLDEACAALSSGLLDREALLSLMDRAAGLDAAAGGDRAACELVLTGRGADPELEARADYVTEMRMVRHPFRRGVAARRGVEW